ncbi:sodium:solute symporter family protein [Arthrobacter sp. UYEF21]|uniref:sodium:solute symporter family protein n=1 Tax=Arthrobacter sp. UYEF21 TaxID=1756364 RepID=UPI003392E263
MTAVAAFVLVLVLAMALGIYSKRGVKTTEDFLVGGRSFGGLLLFILVVGEVYSIGTVVGFPGGVYAEGAGFAVWFMGYILLGYPIGYFLLPLLFKAGRRYSAVTLPDILRGHFNSRPLELTAALLSVIFLIPWAQLQLTGLTVALTGLGLGLTPVVTVMIGVAIAMAFALLSGIKAPAYVSFVKDFALVFAIIVVAVFVLAMNPSIPDITAQADALSGHTTIGPGLPMLHTMSTMLFQAVGFYMFPFVLQAIMSSKSARTIKRTQIGMPLYMLMYPFLLITAYYSISAVPGLTGANTNLAFIEVARTLLPEFLVGIVAGGAALCAIVVLAASALSIGTLVARNVLVDLPEKRQKNYVRAIIAVYLLISIVLTLVVPNLMGTLINTAYYGFTQLIVPVALLVFGSRTRAGVMAAGLAGGVLATLGLYIFGIDLGGLSIGVPALAANIAIVTLGRLTWPRTTPTEAIWTRGHPRSEWARTPGPDSNPTSSTPIRPAGENH